MKAGDRVKWVGESNHPEYRNLSTGTVMDIYEGPHALCYPVEVSFDGYPYYGHHTHPCDFNELEVIND